MSTSNSSLPPEEPKRVVFDFLEELRLLFGKPRRNKQQRKLAQIMLQDEDPVVDAGKYNSK